MCHAFFHVSCLFDGVPCFWDIFLIPPGRLRSHFCDLFMFLEWTPQNPHLPVPVEQSNVRVRQMAAAIAGNHARRAAERKFREMTTKTVFAVPFPPDFRRCVLDGYFVFVGHHCVLGSMTGLGELCLFPIIPFYLAPLWHFVDDIDRSWVVGERTASSVTVLCLILVSIAGF